MLIDLNMNKIEAGKILAEGLSKYRRLTYHQLTLQIDQTDRKEMIGPSGKWYQLVFQVFWDDGASGNIRVLGSIDDGGLRAFMPYTDDFIKSPSGEFVDE